MATSSAHGNGVRAGPSSRLSMTFVLFRCTIARLLSTCDKSALKYVVFHHNLCEDDFLSLIPHLYLAICHFGASIAALVLIHLLRGTQFIVKLFTRMVSRHLKNHTKRYQHHGLHILFILNRSRTKHTHHIDWHFPQKGFSFGQRRLRVFVDIVIVRFQRTPCRNIARQQNNNACLILRWCLEVESMPSFFGIFVAAHVCAASENDRPHCSRDPTLIVCQLGWSRRRLSVRCSADFMECLCCAEAPLCRSLVSHTHGWYRLPNVPLKMFFCVNRQRISTIRRHDVLRKLCRLLVHVLSQINLSRRWFASTTMCRSSLLRIGRSSGRVQMPAMATLLIYQWFNCSTSKA